MKWPIWGKKWLPQYSLVRISAVWSSWLWPGNSRPVGWEWKALPWALSLVASYRINISRKKLVWGFSIHPCKGYQRAHLLFQKTWWAVGIEDRRWPARPLGGEPPAYPMGDNLSPHKPLQMQWQKMWRCRNHKGSMGKNAFLNFFCTFW